MRIALLFMLAACGRIGFGARAALGDAAGDATADSSADSATDSGIDSGPAISSITYVGAFAQRHPGGGSGDAFPAKAVAAGDVIAMQLGCGSTTFPTGVTISAPGWSFDALDTPIGANPLASVQLVAIAPDTAPVMITVIWSGSPCEVGTAVLADEFAGVDTSMGVGGVYTAGAQHPGNGNCVAPFTTVAAKETVWAACFTSGQVSAVGAGYTKGADDGGGDWAEYRITTDPAGTAEDPIFTNTTGYLMDVIELRSR